MLRGEVEALRVPTSPPRRPGAAGRRLRGGRPPGRSPRCSTWSAGPIRIATCPPSAFEGVLELVSGRFPTGLPARPPAPGQLGPGPQPAAPAARDGPARGDRRRDDPRHRPVPGLPRRRRAPARRAGRGVRPRAPGRRDVRAGDGDLADRGDRAAPRARGPRRGAGVARCPSGGARARRGPPSWARPSACSAASWPRRLDDPGVLDWLRSECRLDAPAARRLRDYVARQVAGRGGGPRRPDGPGRDVPRPGGRGRPGRPHAVRRQAAPGPEARAPGPAPASGWGSRSRACTATTAS